MTLSSRRSQSDEKVLAGDSLLVRGLFEPVAELSFEQPVHAAQFLFFAELQAVAHELGLAVFPMLAGNEVAFFDGALLAVAALAFQE